MKTAQHPTNGLTSVNGHSPRNEPLPRPMLEGLLERIEASGVLDAAGKRVGSWFGAVVRPGPVKDLLSGTRMGHPAHPMLTDVPIGTWSSALLLDLLGGERGARAAQTLVGAGLVAAVPTAVTGLSDLTDVTNKKDRTLGVAHALGNSVALVLYGASWLARRRGARAAGIGLGLAGAGAITASGFLGGHLAYRRGVGVDQTLFERRPEEWEAVLDEAELKDGKAKRVVWGTADILLYRSGGRIYAIGNRCSHRGGPLNKGEIEGDTVTCPWHRSTFSLEDGCVVTGPATAPQPAYDVRVQSGKIEVRART